MEAAEVMQATKEAECNDGRRGGRDSAWEGRGPVKMRWKMREQGMRVEVMPMGRQEWIVALMATTRPSVKMQAAGVGRWSMCNLNAVLGEFGVLVGTSISVAASEHMEWMRGSGGTSTAEALVLHEEFLNND